MTALYFAQVREDNRVERMIMTRREIKRAIVIGSGGCTAFSMLGENPEKIYCVDNNPAQVWLIELKRAAIGLLHHEEYLRFIGVKPCTQRMETFLQLREHLPAEAREYWDAHPTSVTMGINRCGITEAFYSWISSCILQYVHPREIWLKLFACNSVEAQQEFFHQYFTRPEWTTATRILLSKQMHLRFFPAFLFTDDPALQPEDFFLRKFREEVCNKRVSDNYFLSQFMLGEYLDAPDGLPYYLTASGFAAAKKNLHRLEVILGGVEECCNTVKDIDAFFLSNVFDWMNESQRENVLNGIAGSGSEASCVCLRNMFGAPDLSLFAKYGLKKEEESSEKLTAAERSMMYNHVTLFSK